MNEPVHLTTPLTRENKSFRVRPLCLGPRARTLKGSQVPNGGGVSRPTIDFRSAVDSKPLWVLSGLYSQIGLGLPWSCNTRLPYLRSLLFLGLPLPIQGSLPSFIIFQGLTLPIQGSLTWFEWYACCSPPSREAAVHSIITLTFQLQQINPFF